VGEYLYDHFFGELIEEANEFRTGPAPGQRMPEVERETVDGERVRIGGRREKPMLLAFGSLTCPMTHAAIPVLQGLYERYGDQIDFVTLYVRECHPGEKIPQPTTYEQKREYARRLRDDHGIPWPVVVDDLEGTLHQQLDPKPSAAYLVDPRGVVMFRSLWSDAPRSLRSGLSAFLREGRPIGEIGAWLGPRLRGLWRYERVLREAGPDALADLRREAPGTYYAARALGLVRHPAFPAVAALGLAVGLSLLRRREA